MGSLKVLISIVSLLIISNAAYATVNVPEPESAALLAIGLAGLIISKTLKRKKKDKD